MYLHLYPLQKFAVFEVASMYHVDITLFILEKFKVTIFT